MEINEVVHDTQKAMGFIEKEFRSINLWERPLGSYKTNFEQGDISVTFCGLPIKKSWAFIDSTSYVLYLISKKDSDLCNRISEYYGSVLAGGELEVMGDNFTSDTAFYIWEHFGLNIYLSGFKNRNKKYDLENCSLIIIGNMDYDDVRLKYLKPF